MKFLKKMQTKEISDLLSEFSSFEKKHHDKNDAESNMVYSFKAKLDFIEECLKYISEKPKKKQSKFASSDRMDISDRLLQGYMSFLVGKEMKYGVNPQDLIDFVIRLYQGETKDKSEIIYNEINSRFNSEKLGIKGNDRLFSNSELSEVKEIIIKYKH